MSYVPEFGSGKNEAEREREISQLCHKYLAKVSPRGGEWVAGNSVKSVSYTHLDVYKRQR